MAKKIKKDNQEELTIPQRFIKMIDETINTPEVFENELNGTLKGITRKEFLKALELQEKGILDKDKPMTFEQTLNSTQTYTDTYEGAKNWVATKLVFFAIEIAYGSMPETEKNILKDKLFDVLERKARQISRNRSKTKIGASKGTNTKNIGELFFSSELNKLISSANKKDYTETDQEGNLIATGINTDKTTIKAINIEGTITPFDTNANIIYTMMQSRLANTIHDYDLSDEERRTVDLTLEEYKTLKDLKDDATARKNMKNAIMAFASNETIIKIPLNNDGESFRAIKIDLTRHVEYIKGYGIKMIVSPEFAEYVPKGYVLKLPKNIYRIDTQKYPSAFNLAKYLCWYYGFNHKKDKGPTSANPEIISVKSLLKECRTIPKYEEIKDSGNIYDRIISPFLSALESVEALKKTEEGFKGNKNGFISYEFVHSKGKELTKKERSDLENGRIQYSDFIKLYIRFNVIYDDEAEKAKLIEVNQKS